MTVDLTEYFTYDETSSSCLKWIKNPHRNIKVAGRDAGHFASNGYYRVSLKGVTENVHRVIWKLLKGDIPSGYIIDHIDCNPRNNRIENLRMTTVKNNTRNRTKRSGLTSKYKGVYFNKKAGKWKAAITHDYKQRFLGYFVDEKDAAEAYVLEALELFGDYSNTEVCNG